MEFGLRWASPQTLVHDILGRNQDLMGGFNDFLARCEAMDIDLADVTRSKDGKLSLKDMQRVKQQVRTRPSFRPAPMRGPPPSRRARLPRCCSRCFSVGAALCGSRC